jgi:hypothetical protein
MLPVRNLLGFRRWLRKVVDRETDELCLRREIVEEIEELSLGGTTEVVGLTFRHVRRVEDGPKAVYGEHFLQFRVLEIMEIRSDTQENRKFCDWIFESALTDPNLLICTQQDIQRGRTTTGRIVGSHTQALLSQEISRADQPLYRG